MFVNYQTVYWYIQILNLREQNHKKILLKFDVYARKMVVQISQVSQQDLYNLELCKFCYTTLTFSQIMMNTQNAKNWDLMTKDCVKDLMFIKGQKSHLHFV